MGNELTRKAAFVEALPTVLAAVLSTNLLVIVIVGVASAAIFNLVL